MKKNKKTIRMGYVYQFVAFSIMGMLVWTVQGCSYLMQQGQFRASLPHLSLPDPSLYQQQKNDIQVKACVIPQLYWVCWQSKKGTTYYLLASRRGALPSACTVAAGKIAFWDGSGKPMSLEQTNELRLLRPNATLLGLLCLARTVVTEEKIGKINWSCMPNNIDFELVYGIKKCSLKGRALQELLGSMIRDAWSQAPRQIVPVALYCEAKMEQYLNQVASCQLQCSSVPSQHRNMVPIVPESGGCKAEVQTQASGHATLQNGGCKAEVQTQASGHATLPRVNETNILGSKSTSPSPPSWVPVLPLHDTSTLKNDVPQLEQKSIDCGASVDKQSKKPIVDKALRNNLEIRRKGTDPDNSEEEEEIVSLSIPDLKRNTEKPGNGTPPPHTENHTNDPETETKHPQIKLPFIKEIETPNIQLRKVVVKEKKQPEGELAALLRKCIGSVSDSDADTISKGTSWSEVKESEWD